MKLTVTPVRAALASPMLRYLAILCVGLVAIAFFLVEFELIRPRWYWLNEKIANVQNRYRLTYNALTRQYRVGVGALYQNFASLHEAREFLSRVRVGEIAEPGALRKDSVYTAALRMRLDTSQLPRPFQITAIGSRDWNIGSDWYRWTVAP